MRCLFGGTSLIESGRSLLVQRHIFFMQLLESIRLFIFTFAFILSKTELFSLVIVSFIKTWSGVSLYFSKACSFFTKRHGYFTGGDATILLGHIELFKVFEGVNWEVVSWSMFLDDEWTISYELVMAVESADALAGSTEVLAIGRPVVGRGLVVSILIVGFQIFF